VTHTLPPFTTMRERDVALRGMRFRLCEWGPAGGPLVLMLHGWLDQGAAFDAVATQLANKGAWVVAPDHRGHGHSAWAPAGSTYHFLEYVADVDALVDLLVVEHPGVRPFTLVGHSMGGTISALYAGLRPSSVAALVLIDGLGPPAVSDSDAAEQARTFLDQCRAPRPHRPMPDLATAAARIQRTNPGLVEARAEYLARRVTRPADSGGIVWRWDPLHRTRAAVAFDVDRLMVVLRKIRCPASLLVGADGWYAHLPDLGDRLDALGGGAVRIDLACGHDVHHARYLDVVRHIDEARLERS